MGYFVTIFANVSSCCIMKAIHSLQDSMNYLARYYRHCILYPLRLRPLFPYDVGILKPKVGLGSDQIEFDLRKMF